MKRKKSRRSSLLRDLPLVLGFFAAIALIIAAAWLVGRVHEHSKRVEFLETFNLSGKLVANIEDYTYWNDPLAYTDGYEAMVVRIEPSEWAVPEGWKTEGVSPIEVFELHDVSMHPALKNLEGYNLLAEYPEWFYCEVNPDGFSSEHSIYAGFYDQAGALLLYRAHNLTSY